MTANEKRNAPPIAYPIAPRNNPSNPNNHGPAASLQESTESPLLVSSQSRPNNRSQTVGRRRLEAMVSERDLQIMRSVTEHKHLTTRHIYELAFFNHASFASGIRACNRVLNRLRDHRLLRRLDRPVGGDGGGSQSYVWALDVAGDRLLRGDSDQPRRRPFEPSTPFLAHTLSIADRRIEIEKAARNGAFEVVAVKTEPNNWRSFPGTHAKRLWLKPDLEVTTANGDWEHDWFIEEDLGTESGTALMRKCSIYLTYYKTQREQLARGTFPRVVWLMPSDRRVALLERLLAPAKAPVGLFTITTHDRLVELLSAPDDFQTSAGEPPPSKTPQGDG